MSTQQHRLNAPLQKESKTRVVVATIWISYLYVFTKYLGNESEYLLYNEICNKRSYHNNEMTIQSKI